VEIVVRDGTDKFYVKLSIGFILRGIPFIVSPNTAALSHGKSASTETCRDCRGAQDKDKTNAVYYRIFKCRRRVNLLVPLSLGDRNPVQRGKLEKL
jgi:hypothetical protein